MKRPDYTFTIAVRPVVWVTHCQEALAKEKEGFFGFHLSTTCPHCSTRDGGWEFWGENGHLQGAAHTRDELRHWIKYTVRRQWRAIDGKTIGYRFVVRPAMRYLAN